MAVPAAVPSVRHSSRPCTPSSAAKSTVSSGSATNEPGWLSRVSSPSGRKTSTSALAGAAKPMNTSSVVNQRALRTAADSSPTRRLARRISERRSET